MKRRILAILMIAAMILTMVPIVALAGPSGLTISLVNPVITIVAETKGKWITDGNNNTYYRYDMPSDKITFIVEDNNMLVSQNDAYSFSMGEDNFFFAFDWESVQTYENKWEKGGTYYVPVHLVCPNNPSKNEPEIVSIEVNIISLVDDINITSPIVGLVGEPNYLNFDYSIEFNPAIIDSINIMDGGRSFMYDHYYTVELDRSKIDFNTPGVYTTTASVAGCSKEVEVTINPAPITDYSVSDVLLYQYVDGYYQTDINGEVWFYYWLKSPNILSVTAPNDDVSLVEEEGAWSNSALYENKTYFANIDSIYPMNEDSDHELELGKTPVKARLFGIEKDININVVEVEDKNKISDIIVRDVEIAPGEEMVKGNLIDMEIHYKDGSVGYNSDSSYLDSIGNAIPIEVFYENGDEPYGPNGWAVGSTHKVTLYFLGKPYAYNVTIRDDGVQSAELVNKNLQRPKGVNLSDVLAGEEVKITYKNGETEIKKYSELEGISYIKSWEDPSGCSLNYGGVSSEFTVEDIETITKIELDSDSVGKAYWNGKQYEYTPSGLTATFFFDDGTSEVVENIGWGVGALEHDGYKYGLACDTKGVSDPNNNTLEAYVGVRTNDNIEIVSNMVPVGIADSSIGVKNIKLLSAPTSKHYIGDTFFSSCIGEDKFKPYDFTGLEVEVEMDDGEKFILYGDDITSFNGDSPTYLLSGNSSGHKWIIGFTNQTKTSADLSVWVLGERVDNLCTIKREPSPYKSIEIVSCPSDSQLDNCDATGLQFKVTTNDGKSEIITLGAPLPGDGKFGAYVMIGGRTIDAPYVGGGDGGILFVPVDGVPGLRYNAYSVGSNQYVSIVWNNGILRFADQMVVINPDKYTTINGDVEVDIDNNELSKAIIDSLPIDKRYAVEQQGAPIFNSIDADEVDVTDKITVKANDDDTDIKSCYDINFSYLVQGNEYQLTELPNGKIAVTVPLDESLWGKSKDEIVLYREHAYADGTKVEQITDFTISDDGKFITFESDKFSTFALGYKDKKDVPPGGNGGTNNEKPILPETVENVANTLDNTPIAATMMLVCSSGLCLFAVARKRKELE